MNRSKLVHISQGEFAIGSSEEDSVTTVLGSCVSACLWDPSAGIGGMNHILVPDGARGLGALHSYGVNAMEILINEIIKHGGTKLRLEAKLFGGASMIERLGDVGKRNAEFTLNFLEAEGIPCRAQSLGGTQARRIQFWPHDGRARQKLLGEKVALPELRAPLKRIAKPNDVELF